MPKIRCALGRVALSVALLLSTFFAVLALADSENLADALVRIEWPVVASMVVCLTVGALLSSLRLKLIVNDFRYPLSVRDAVITLSVGQLAGNLFFQAAGQMIGRAAILAQHGIPTSVSVIISGYERIFSLGVSILLAACGAVYLFGV